MKGVGGEDFMLARRLQVWSWVSGHVYVNTLPRPTGVSSRLGEVREGGEFGGWGKG